MAVIALEEKYRGYTFSAQAEKEGLVAVGGNLSTDSLLLAYKSGVFPWFTPGDPILWWSPDPRLILLPENYRCSHSMRQVINSGKFEIKYDTNFVDVITNCSKVLRPNQEGTWISPEIVKAYKTLHRLGYAHSVETYYQGQLVGGLYGVVLGKAFFGESMFHFMSNASKFAFYHLVLKVKELGIYFIDAQQQTDHLKSLGARSIPRKEFLVVLEKALESPDRTELWNL
ncbi:MAG: leucyl/phenylalanyl-tRNA--protein transferase [Bacteroidales bacterium]|nr:leucyl/phenylalanyl-tRNA--protein transferase [Bacteroidales bacterium]MDD3665029.1 leucyl/phenylalanyl-tRNA--protein transferase [Bacteroidales bacterium]